MSTAASPHPSPASGSRAAGSFVFSRFGSALAVLPLGVWTVFHLWNNLAAFRGAEAWEGAVTHYPHPLASLITSLVVLAPLLLHTLWGISRLVSSRPNNGRYNNYVNLKYLLQRVSAVGVLAFVGAHLWLAYLHPRFVEGHTETFADISREMHHHLPTLVVYVLGTLGVSYHLANGLQMFGMSWGILGSNRALRRAEPFTIAAFLILLAMSWGAVYALWDAGR